MRVKCVSISAPIFDDSPHYFELEYEEEGENGRVKSSLIPGTLNDLGPLSKEEREQLFKQPRYLPP